MRNLPSDLQAALLGRRVVFLRGQLDEAVANSVIGQLLLVAQMEPGRTIDLYVDSPGGAYTAALSLHDVLQTLGSPVSTTCTGTAGGAAVLVLAAGAAGRRAALPHARIHLMHERMDLPGGQPADLAGHAGQAAVLRGRWQTGLARLSAHSVERLDRDMRAGTWLSAAEARDYGLVDGIFAGQS